MQLASPAVSPARQSRKFARPAHHSQSRRSRRRASWRRQAPDGQLQTSPGVLSAEMQSRPAVRRPASGDASAVREGGCRLLQTPKPNVPYLQKLSSREFPLWPEKYGLTPDRVINYRARPVGGPHKPARRLRRPLGAFPSACPRRACTVLPCGSKNHRRNDRRSLGSSHRRQGAGAAPVRRRGS